MTNNQSSANIWQKSVCNFSPTNPQTAQQRGDLQVRHLDSGVLVPLQQGLQAAVQTYSHVDDWT